MLELIPQIIDTAATLVRDYYWAPIALAFVYVPIHFQNEQNERVRERKPQRFIKTHGTTYTMGESDLNEIRNSYDGGGGYE